MIARPAIRNGQLTDAAVDGIDVTKLDASTKADLRRVIGKGGDLSTDDLQTVAKARRQSGVAADPLAKIGADLRKLEGLLK